MAGRSCSPPLEFIAPPTFPSFAPGNLALQQVPFCKQGVGVERSGAPPPFSSPADTLASLHEKYHELLSHERQGKDLERSIWEVEKMIYVQRIASLETTVKDLRAQLGKPQSEVAAVIDAPGGLEKSHTQPEDVVPTTTTSTSITTTTTSATSTTEDIPGGLVDAQPAVAARCVDVGHVPSVDPVVAHEDSFAEEPKDEPTRADSPSFLEYPYPKTPKSVKGDMERDESEIVNLLDQAGRILGKTSYGMHHYDNEYDDSEEEFKLILKPNRNFASNWAF